MYHSHDDGPGSIHYSQEVSGSSRVSLRDVVALARREIIGAPLPAIALVVMRLRSAAEASDLAHTAAACLISPADIGATGW